MSLGHVYIVLEPVGSARLTFDDDMYYELCVFDDRSLFGVPNEITDVSRGVSKWFGNICEFIGLELGQMELCGAHELRGAPCELVALS